MSHMRDEIAETPAIVRARCEGWAREAEALRETLARPHLVLLGRGSSGNAATFAAYLHGMTTGRHAIELRPWIGTQPAPHASYADAAALVYSFSGQSTDVASAAQWLRARGASVVGVTNSEDPDCHVGRAADALFHLRVGQERAVPATKSYGAQLFASAALCGLPVTEAARDAADCMDRLLASDAAERLTDFLEGARTILWIARGPALAAALDAALKMQETATVPSFAYSAAEVLHGPIAAIDVVDRVVLLADSDEPAASIAAVTTALLGRGVPFARVGVGDTSSPIPVPLPAERWARTPVLAMLSQLAAVSLAERRGLDPDAPRGLNKVTLT